MAMYGSFAAPVLGMLTQASAFGTISQNITNLNTGGYKASQTRFSTVLASTFDANSDVGGVRSLRQNFVSTQGRMLSTDNKFDLAISGKGMFVLQTELTGGDTFYSRDGGFHQTATGTQTVTIGGNTFTTEQVYLTDKNGNYLMGIEPDANGDFLTTSQLVPVRVDAYAFSSVNQASTSAEITVNLPVVSGTPQVSTASIYTEGLLDANGDLITGSNLKQLDFNWTKASGLNQWTLTVTAPGGETAPVDYTSTGTSPLTQTFTFDSEGRLAPGTTFSFTVPWADGQTASTIDLDVSSVTSIGDEYLYGNFLKDGRSQGELSEVGFDDKGHVYGLFTNGVVSNLYQLPLAVFPNPDGLNYVQGNRFTESPTSGAAELAFANEQGYATFLPFTHELSNTNLENEFTTMIQVQQAYNMSATVFSTVDDMTKVAAELKA